MAIWNIVRGFGSVAMLFGKVALCVMFAVGDRLHATPSQGH